MHEASMANAVVQVILREAHKQNAERVESIEIDIGELTFLGVEQIEFWIKTGLEGTLAQGAKIQINRIQGSIRCRECGYQGALELKEDPSYHLRIPSFICPKCQSQVEITGGKEAVVRRIRILKPS